MKFIYIILLTTLFSCKAEVLSDAQLKLKSSSVEISSLSKLNNELYDIVSTYEVIMIGEMHGTNEPSEFAYGLCELISKHEDEVVMAMEISPSQMEGYHKDMTLDELKGLNFFNGENSSGMNGEAWLNLIHNCNQNENIKIEFFDYQRVSPRDSSMYTAIRDLRSFYPNSKIVTLSGNIHNRLEPFNDKMVLGTYLLKDTVNFEKEKIMSIMHYFNEGTMLNNMGNGLELKTIEPKEDVFNKTVSANMLFCDNIFDDRTYFTHIFYTSKVTHSKIIDNNFNERL